MGSWFMNLSDYIGGRCLWKLNSMGGWVQKKMPSSPLQVIFFWNSPHAYTIIPVIKRLKNLEQIQFIANLHLYTPKSVCATSTRPFGEVGGNSPLQLSARTHFAKIENKKVIAKN